MNPSPSSLFRRVVRTLIAVVASCIALSPALAQITTSKPISVMVPYPAGGPSDAMARAFAEPFAREVGQTVIVENLGGASGTVAAQRVLNAPADGHYLFQGSPNEIIIAPLANSSVQFKPKDFRLIQLMGEVVMVVAARKDLPVNSLDELIALARKSADAPLSYGSNGVGSLNHLIAEDMQQRTGIKLTHVPYRGSAPLQQDLGGGQIDFAVLVYSSGLGAMAEQGRVKLLAQFPAKRSDFLPQLPTASEGKELKNFSYRQWTGFMVPKSTPEPIVRQLHKAINATLPQPSVKTQFAGQAAVASPATTLEEANRFFEAEAAHYRTLARQINLQPQ